MELDASTKSKPKTKAATSTSTEPKRRGRAAKKVETDNETDGTDDEIGVIEETKKKTTNAKSQAKATSATGARRGRKPAAERQTRNNIQTEAESDDEDELAKNEIHEVPKKRIGRPRTKPVKEESEVKPTAPRGRGRPRSNTKTAEESGKKKQSKDTVEDSAPKPIYITTNSTAMRSNILRGPAKKKTVTFKDLTESEEEQEEQGESLPEPPTRRRRATGVQEGMGAKPVRKPAAGTGAGRGRKPTAAKRGKPLSPKKANQVQKTLSSYASSDGEEDELSGAKDQIKLVVDSPIKHGSEIGSISPVRRVNFTPNKPPKSVDENGEPTLHPARSIDFSDSVYMSSPARRPASSPFQYTMRETPKRSGLGFRDSTRPLAQPNLSPIEGSPLKSSPKKGNFGASSMGIPQPDFTPNQSPLKASPKKGSPMKGTMGAPSLPASQPEFGAGSPLKTSPKKGNLGASFCQTPTKASTPFTVRTCLTQSPAKKVPSPFKGSMTPSKAPLGESTGMDTDPQRRVSVASRAASKSPEKVGTPRNMDFEADEAPGQVSPAVPERQEAEHDLANDEAVNMVEEHADREQTIEFMDQTEDRVEEHLEEHDHGDHSELNMEDLVDNDANDNGRNNTEYDTFDCGYLQTEVRDTIEECQRQIDDYSEAEQVDQHDNYSKTSENAENQSEDEMNKEEDLNLVPEVRSRTGTPRKSLTEGLEDVFVDTPASRRRPDNVNVEARRDSAETIDENSTGEPVEMQLEEHGAHTEIEDVEGDVAFDAPEPSTAGSELASPERAAEQPDPLDEKNVEEPPVQMEEKETPAEEQGVAEQDVNARGVSEEPERAPLNEVRSSEICGMDEIGEPEHQNMEEQDGNARMESEEPERKPVDSVRGSSPEIEESDGRFDENNVEEPVNEDTEDQDTEEDEDTRLTSEAYRVDSARASPYEVNENEGATPSHAQAIPPPVPFPPSRAVNHGNAYRETARYSMESNATSIIESGEDTRRLENLTAGGNSTPFYPSRQRRSLFRDSLGFSPLANQFSQWKTTSPGKLQPESRRRRGMFSLTGGLRRSSGVVQNPATISHSHTSQDSGEVPYPDISKHPLADTQSLFAELPLQKDSDSASDIYEDQEQEPEVPRESLLESVESERQPMDEIFSEPEDEMTIVDEAASRRSSAVISNHENSPAPSTHSVPEQEAEDKENVLAGPSIPATPMRNKINPMQTFHTVSKVPLKPEGDVSPLKFRRKRGRSLSNTSPVRSSPRLRKPLLAPKNDDEQSSPRKMPRLDPTSHRKRSNHVGEEIHKKNGIPTSASPSKSPRKSIGASSQVLQGVVVHVDVHTTEGEDASGIFIELLQQMGARCVKNWAWNPRSSLSPVDGADPKDGKVGITHVVFKDGGVRTLEKVRQAGGLVKCVGVGWVLELVRPCSHPSNKPIHPTNTNERTKSCERENKWLDESPYTVDSTIIPRGGAKRRKSMQPRALSNVNGTLTSTSTSRRSIADSESVETFMRLSPPTPSRNDPGTPLRDLSQNNNDSDAYNQTPRTPGSSFNFDFNFNFDSIGMSPATPFYLQKSNIVQQSCPPKQTQQGLFSNSPSAEHGMSSQRLRFKLEAARRKSHAYKPRLRSPLVE